MRLRNVKGAKEIIESSNYVVLDYKKYRGNYNKLFKNNNPIYVEIGMGKGKFIIDNAIKYPNINFIGLELYPSQMVMATEKLKSEKITNLKLINDDARNIDKIFGKEISTIYLTFSEPWPKGIDEKNRFTHISYLKLYDKIFKKNKHIILKTDNKGLFAYSLETLSQYWYTFNKVSLDLHHDERQISNIMTDFEKQYEKEGRPIYYVDATFDE